MSIVSRLWTLAGGGAAAALAAWWLDAIGVEPPRLLSSALVVAAALALTAAAAGELVRAVRSEDAARRRSAWVLTALLALSFGLRCVGLDFELLTHFHNDEGIFLSTAREINDGALLPEHFHYPHLLYYLSALTLWLHGLFPGVIDGLAAAVYGVEGQGVPVLLLRLLAATLGALTTLPVYLAARRAAGTLAGALAGALIACSPIYNEVAHLAISDVPSGFFAALTLWPVARLLDGENLRDYLLAGVSAALAAASKYPAGLCAVAIVGIWVYWRLRRRDLNLLLAASGAVSILTLLAVMPALWLRFDNVFQGPGEQDILFGFRQYARSGWIGVIVQSTWAYYLDGLREAFGWVAVAAGALGVALLPSRPRRRTLGLLPYPLAFLLLLAAMSMVVKRNMQPLLPAVAVVLGAGLSAWPRLAAQRAWGRTSVLAAGVVAVALAGPALRTVAWDVSRTRPGTRQLAVDWIEEHVPQGAAFVKEAYTPDLHPRRFVWRQSRYAARLEVEEIRDPRWDYLLLARNAHVRFLREESRTKPHHDIYYRRYLELFELPLVEAFRPGLFRSGPELLLYRLDPEQPLHRRERRFGPADVSYFSDPALDRGPGPVRFDRRGQWVLFKDYFEPGRYRVGVTPQPAGVRCWLHVVTRDNREIGQVELTPAAEIELPVRGKYFLRTFLSAGGELGELRLRAAAAGV